METDCEKLRQQNHLAGQLTQYFRSLGCDSNIKCGIAERIFMDLIYAVKLSRIESHYDSKLDEIYFLGEMEKDEALKKDVYIPCSYFANVNLSHLNDIQNDLAKKFGESVILCVSDASGNVLYYRFTKGLQERVEEKKNEDVVS